MSEEILKEKFKIFFEKYPSIKRFPFLINIVIPKYECKGEKTIIRTGGILEDHISEKYPNIEKIYKDIKNDIPRLSIKDSFSLFKENVLVTVNINNSIIEFEVVDYTNEIYEMY